MTLSARKVANRWTIEFFSLKMSSTQNLCLIKLVWIYRGNEEGDPAHHDKHGGGEVDGEDEGAQ